MSAARTRTAHDDVAPPIAERVVLFSGILLIQATRTSTFEAEEIPGRGGNPLLLLVD